MFAVLQVENMIFEEREKTITNIDMTPKTLSKYLLA